MFQKVLSVVLVVALLALGVVVYVQSKAIARLSVGTESLSVKLDGVSTKLSADFADWTGRLDAIQQGYSNLGSGFEKLKGSVEASNRLSREYFSATQDSYASLTGLSEQLVTILGTANADSAGVDTAIDRLRKLGVKLEGFLGSEASGVQQGH